MSPLAQAIAVIGGLASAAIGFLFPPVGAFVATVTLIGVLMTRNGRDEESPPKHRVMARGKNHYFDNPTVEALLIRYVNGACVDIALRDELMEHALPLIRGVIRANQLCRLLHYRHRSSEDELTSVAWAQIEKTLYKFDPGRAKVFNLWTQIAYTSCMAFVKKETRDAVAVRKWEKGEGNPAPLLEKRRKPDFYGVMDSLREVCTYHTLYLEMIDHLVDLYETDDDAYRGIYGKLSAKYGSKEAKAFLGYVRHRRSDVDL